MNLKRRSCNKRKFKTGISQKNPALHRSFRERNLTVRKKEIFDPKKLAQKKKTDLLKELEKDGLFGRLLERERQNFKRMFSFKPLIQIPKEDLFWIQRSSKLTMEYNVARLKDLFEHITRGEAELIYQNKKLSLSRETISRIFKSPNMFNETIIRVGNKEYSFPRYNISRGLEDYWRGLRIRIENQADLVLKKKSTNVIRVMDVGAGTGEMLEDLSELMRKKGKTVEKMAVNFENFPLKIFKESRELTVDYFPREFKEKFDLIASLWALPYSLFPNYGVRNIVESLSLNGRSAVQWTISKKFINFSNEALTQFISHLKKHSLIQDSNATKKFFFILAKKGYFSSEKLSEKEAEKIALKISDSFSKKLLSNVSYEKISALRTLLWINELSRIDSDERFKIMFVKNQMIYNITIPETVLIERVK